MTTEATTPTYQREIIYDRTTRDYSMYLDGELVGFARTYHEAEVTLDQLVFELVSAPYLQETATTAPDSEIEVVTTPEPQPEPASVVPEIPASSRLATLHCVAQVEALLEQYHILHNAGLMDRAAQIKRQAIDLVGLACSAAS
ncbi:MAG: hypothetical protein AAGF95_35225 [Chloroflexota bacterium]